MNLVAVGGWIQKTLLKKLDVDVRDMSKPRLL